jgi:hypothetical protein
LPNVIEHANVGMIQAGNGFGFAFETLLADTIGREVRWEDFYGYCAVEPRIFCAVDFSHPARADGSQDLVGSQPDAGG